MQQPDQKTLSPLVACAAIIACTVLGLAGTDLVLPAVPALPQVFGATTAESQLVLALYVGGSSIGLFFFGSLSSHMGRRRLFIVSLALFSVASALAATASSIETLNIVRFLQGAAAAGPAVLAPGLIRSLFSELGTIRAIAAMGSIESLTPGLAPILGAWLFSHYGWQSSFTVTAAIGLALCAIFIALPRLLPSIGTKADAGPGSYRQIIGNATYLRYALSHACVLGGLLTFVFSAPAVIAETMGGTIDDFIMMQIVGVSTFIVVSNLSGSLVKRFGVELVIMAGTVIATLGGLALLLYALLGTNDPAHLKFVFWILNVGLGVRGGPGFVRALSAAGGDDDRASALLIFFITATAAGGTALVAPLIEFGIVPLTIAVALIVGMAQVLMLVIKPLAPPTEKANEES